MASILTPIYGSTLLGPLSVNAPQRGGMRQGALIVDGIVHNVQDHLESSTKVTKAVVGHVKNVSYATDKLGLTVARIKSVFGVIFTVGAWISGIYLVAKGAFELYWAYKRSSFFGEIRQKLSENTEGRAARAELIWKHFCPELDESLVAEELVKFSKKSLPEQYEELQKHYEKQLSTQAGYSADIINRSSEIIHTAFMKERRTVDMALRKQAGAFEHLGELKNLVANTTDLEELRGSLLEAKRHLVEGKMRESKAGFMKRIVSSVFAAEIALYGGAVDLTEKTSHQEHVLRLYKILEADYQKTQVGRVAGAVQKLMLGTIGILAMVSVTGWLINIFVAGLAYYASVSLLKGRVQNVRYLSGSSVASNGGALAFDARVHDIFLRMRRTDKDSEKEAINSRYLRPNNLYAYGGKRNSKLPAPGEEIEMVDFASAPLAPKRKGVEEQLQELGHVVKKNSLWRNLRATFAVLFPDNKSLEENLL